MYATSYRITKILFLDLILKLRGCRQGCKNIVNFDVIPTIKEAGLSPKLDVRISQYSLYKFLVSRGINIAQNWIDVNIQLCEINVLILTLFPMENHKINPNFQMNI